MKQIPVKHIKTEAVKIPVIVKRDITKMTTKQIIEKLDLFNFMLDKHYNVFNPGYKKYDDVESEEMAELIADVLYEYFRDEDANYNFYANNVIDELRDKVIDEIISGDDNAEEDRKVREAGLKGDY